MLCTAFHRNSLDFLVKSKVLADATNTPPKVYIPVKTVVYNDLSKSSVRTQSKNYAPSIQSSEIEDEFLSKKLSTSAMPGSTTALERIRNCSNR
jgi:hypothetical protein